MKHGFLAVLAFLSCVSAASAAVANLAVGNFSFQPSQIDTLVNPEQVSFTITNLGPDAVSEITVTYILSTNSVQGDADDYRLAGHLYSIPLGPGQRANVSLDVPLRADLTIPADAGGTRYVFLWAQTTYEIDPVRTNNVATNVLSISPPATDTYMVFANTQIASSNFNLMSALSFDYNSDYGNSWRIFLAGGGFAATFTAPAAGEYTLRVRHMTAPDAGCPGNGYAPVTILVNDVPVVSNFDVAQHHGGSLWYEDDRWTITAQEGENVIAWAAGDLCSHYWIQRIEILPKPQPLRFENPLALPDGSVQLTLTGRGGLTNVIEVSTNLSDWGLLTNLYNATGTIQWIDESAGTVSQRFYRAFEL